MNKSQPPNKDLLATIILGVAGFGVLLTIVTELSHHYPLIMELCGGQISGCADVNSTPYAKLFGISVAYLGLLSYIAYILSALYKPSLTLPLAAAMMGAELYFLWIMEVVIEIYCTFCIIQFATVVILFALTVAWHRNRDDFFLPGRLWSSPVVILAVFAAMAAPVQFSSRAPALVDAEFITYEGDPNSAVRVELFSDYECGYCKRLEPEIDKLIENRPDVLLVFRDYVIGGHKLSPVATSYANAIAFTQSREKFVEVRRELFRNQDKLYEYLQAHVGEITFTEELKAKINEKVTADMKRAEAFGIFSTPSMVIYRGDKVVQVIKGIAPYEKFSRFLNP